MSPSIPDGNKLAERLRQAREFAGLSQAQVARLLNMHRPTVSEIEAGRRRVSAEELSEFARVYDVGMNWLLCKGGAEGEGDLASIELAARQLSKLKKEDRETVIKLVRSLSGRKDGSQ